MTTADPLADLEQYVGRRHSAQDVVTASQVARLAVTLDVAHPAPSQGDPLPPGWHAALFPQLVPVGRLRPDGQPGSGGLTPDVPLPRRLLASVRSAYHEPLRIGDDVTRVTEVASIEATSAETGSVVHMIVRETISTPRGLGVVDVREVVFFGPAGLAEAEGLPALPEAASWSRTYESDPVTIFRLSAVRFNSHRIHYDRDHARQEGYPGLVVPVSLVSLQMLEMLRSEVPGRRPSSFSYRSHRPIFEPGSYTLAGAPSGQTATLWATDGDAVLAMTASVTFADSGTLDERGGESG